MARVKICGIRSLADMQIAVQQGTDAIGVLVGKLHSSSDFVPANLAAEICERTPPFVTSVLVTHLEDPDSVLALADTIPSAAVQLHSDITPALIDTLRRALAPRKVIAKIGVEGPSAIERARDLDQRVDAIVLDSVNRATDQVGGTGLTHDWSISSQIVKQISNAGHLGRRPHASERWKCNSPGSSLGRRRQLWSSQPGRFQRWRPDSSVYRNEQIA